jgi:hypothetical protein
MDAIRKVNAIPVVLRRALSGLAAGFAGGCTLVALLFIFDIAHLRSLMAAAEVPLAPWDWLRVPLAFAVLGMATAFGSGSGEEP